MRESKLGQWWETLESEKLKAAAEFGLSGMSKLTESDLLFAALRRGERIYSPALSTTVAGLTFENPLLVGAGWDKKGRAVDALHRLGFAGVEVGSVLPFPQEGNPKPRMWYDASGAGYNRLGFNSPGQEVVAHNLAKQNRVGVVGVSLGKNKLLPAGQAPWAHAVVAERLHKYADYFVINVASPNTPGLRSLLKREPLTDIAQACRETIDGLGRKPLFIKTTVDLNLDDLATVMEVALRNDVDGLIDSNTTVSEELKKRYGWSGLGGVSGNVPEYRSLATDRMKHITRESRGTGLQRMGVGAISDADSAWERLAAGAQALQLVTAIRQHGGSVARTINAGLLERAEAEGLRNIGEIVGSAI